jgi:ABC-type nitrate/sulfonate/bicarbonate transport system substrate-binding protein
VRPYRSAKRKDGNGRGTGAEKGVPKGCGSGLNREDFATYFSRSGSKLPGGSGRFEDHFPEGFMLKAALFLLLTIAFTGCQQSAPGQFPPLTVRLAYTTQHDSALLHLAILKGYFAQEGLVVQPQIHRFGKEALAAVVEGKADMATVAETPFVLSVLNGKKIVIVAGIFSSGVNNGIVALRPRGITKAADLKGKRIAVTPGTTSEFFLHSFLAGAGIGRQQVVEVATDPDRMPDAVLSGRVDAASTWNPMLKSIGRGLGRRGEIFFDRNLYTQTFLLSAGAQYVENNREAVRRVLRALLKAEAFAAEHASEAQRALAVELPMDLGLLRECWSESRFRVSLDQSLLIALEDETRWAIGNGLSPTAAMPNYLGYLSFDALQAVQPLAVTIQK